MGPVRWEDNSLGLVINASLTVNDSVVEIICDSNLYATDDHINEVYMRALDMARAAIDTFGFITGIGGSVLLDKVIKPDGIEYPILVQRPDLAGFVTAFNLDRQNKGANFDAMYQIVLGDPLIFMSLNDLMVSISLPHHAPVNCGRAIEAIRELMTPTTADTKEGWEIMREKLNIDRAYLSFVTDQSKGPRHGNRKNITNAAFQETIKRSWIIMNRFLEYKKRGAQQLPVVDFPLLTN